MNGYELSRFWFSFAFKTDGVKPVHTALFFWIVERANASGWKKVIDIQTEKSMECLGITDWRTYKAALQFLAEHGIIIWVGQSKNQYTCNRVSLTLKEEEEGSFYKIAYATNAEAHAEAIVEAIVEAHAEAHVEAIAEALQSYINLKTNKHKNKETLKPSSLHKDAIEIFAQSYLERYHTKYIVQGGKDGSAMKSLLLKIKAKVKEGNMEPTDENIINGFRYFISTIQDKWVLDNFSIAVINSKFNELFKTAKNGTNNSKSDHSDYLKFKHAREQTGSSVYSEAR